jgi:uncharacterized protein YecE (DUF72 family)
MDDETPDDFKFFIKIPKTIFPFRILKIKKEGFLPFVNINENLGNKLASF